MSFGVTGLAVVLSTLYIQTRSQAFNIFIYADECPDIRHCPLTCNPDLGHLKDVNGCEICKCSELMTTNGHFLALTENDKQYA